MALGWLFITEKLMIAFRPSNEAFEAEFVELEAAND